MLEKLAGTLEQEIRQHHLRLREVKVILPAYNEAETLPLLLGRLDQAFWESNLPSEIIVINDGSTDSTAETVKAFKGATPVRLIEQHPNRGLAETIKNGLFTVAPDCDDDDIIIVMDADNTHTPGLIFQMVRLIKEGCDLVIASRYQKGAAIKGVSEGRKFLSWGASILFRTVVRLPGVKDYTCGYRAYRVGLLKLAIEHYREDFIRRTGFACMTEILIRIKKFEPIIREVPLILRYDHKKSASKMNIGLTVFETLSMLLSYMFRRNY